MFRALVTIWANLISSNSKTIDDVPTLIKKQVLTKLDEQKETTPTE